MTYLMIDLFAGLGGASQCMINDEKWDVLQFDNNPDLIQHNPNLIMMDLSNKYNMLMYLNDIDFYKYQKILIWASPPCLEFSYGYNSPRSIAQREGRKYSPDLTLMLSSKWIIDVVMKCHPNVTWVIENVRGAINDFTPHLGQFRKSINAFFLWGNFATLQIDEETARHVKPDARHSEIRSNIRAKVPKGISKAIKETVESQIKITSYLSHQDRD